MSGGMACKCAERKEPIEAPEGANRAGRLWRVRTYMHNNSHFHGGYQSSKYSGLICMVCGRGWRTAAPYVHRLQHMTDADRELWLRGTPEDHRAYRLAHGREVHDETPDRTTD